MRKSRLIGVLLLLFLPIVAFAAVANAQTFRTGNTATVGKGETIDSTLWTSGQTIDIAGEVNGDVFCIGQTVNISGKIHGDIICAGQTVNISGSVDGDIRAAGQTVSLSSQIQNNLSVAGQTVTLENRSEVGGDVSLAAQNTAVNGSVGRDLALGANAATVSGQVGRDIQANLENLTIAGGARIGGNIDYTSTNEAVVASSAKIGGQTTRSEPKNKEHAGGSNFGFMLFASLALLISALVLVLIFPKTFHQVSSQAIKAPGKTFLTGFVATIVAPVLIVLVMITVLGIPLGLLAIASWLLILMLSGAFAAYYTGRLVWRKQTNPLQIMLVGGIILLAARLVPVLGFIATIFAVWFGAGMILLELKKRTPKPGYELKNLK